MKITYNQDASGSTRKNLLYDITLLFVQYKVDTLKNYFDEDIVWALVGDSPIVGKDNFTNALRKMGANKANELTIHDIMVDSKSGAVHGEMTMEDGTQYGFSDFYIFTSSERTLIKSIRSYIVKLN